MSGRRAALAVALLCLTAAARAQRDPDADALSLADRAPVAAAPARGWQMALEAAPGQSLPRAGGPAQDQRRLSLDFQFDQRIGADWRALLSNQLDLRWRPAGRDTVDTLREAYLSWQPRPQRLFDLGRINVRNGVAIGYNPTDYFRRGATRSVISIDPDSLKKNRLGSVMLRGQTLWDGGSLTALYSPRLAARASDAPFNFDLGATNQRHRVLFALGAPLSDEIRPQWLLYGEQGRAPQLGMNLTYLLSDAAVAHVEWSGGRGPTLLSQALRDGGASAFHSSLASGVTYTTSNKISLSAELEFNGAAPDRAGWDALARSPAAYGQYRLWAQDNLEPPTRHALFFHALWQDALFTHLDLRAMSRRNGEDRSRLSWLEARYHWDRADLALQWQVHSGRAGSEFGAAPQRRVAQALLRYFF